MALLLEAPLRAHVILTIARLHFRDIALFVTRSQIAELRPALHTMVFTSPKLFGLVILRNVLAFVLVDVRGMNAIEIRTATPMHLFAIIFQSGNTRLIGLITIIRVII